MLHSGTQLNGTYGYVRKDGNTYTWILTVARGAEFSITEENYDIVVDGVRYDIAAQYSVVNASDEEQDADIQQWFGTVPGYSSTHPSTEVDFTSLMKTNLYNTYMETGTFVIQKKDGGTNYTPMPGVDFRVYELKNGSRRQLNASKKAGTSDTDGHYTVLYENGVFPM